MLQEKEEDAGGGARGVEAQPCEGGGGTDLQGGKGPGPQVRSWLVFT